MHPSSREKPPRAAFFVPAFRATPPVPSPHRMGTRKNPALDYQSERHCSKTGLCRCRCSLPLDYQSERHCSKTMNRGASPSIPLDYQSERHCSKTLPYDTAAPSKLDYQSERHCSKTRRKPARAKKGLDYQSERHCSKTRPRTSNSSAWLDYQSERHCSKTDWQAVHVEARWITSQNDTAPKRDRRKRMNEIVGLPVRTTLLQNV